MENKAEHQEVKMREVIDILSGAYNFHWTSMEKLRKILSGGIYSSAFAHRIGDQEFHPRTNLHDYSERGVFVTSDVNKVFSVRNEEDRLVAIAVNVRQESLERVPIRIAPREIVGLVVIDRCPPKDFSTIPYFDDVSTPKKARRYAERKVEQIIKFFGSGEQTKTGILPIYGISGDCYWPKRITHEEIVQMLKERDDTA